MHVWDFTIQPTAQMVRNFEDLYAFPIFNRKFYNAKYRGFCLNRYCCAEKKATVRLNSSATLIKAWYTETIHLIDCPKCKHALYWTRRWAQPE